MEGIPMKFFRLFLVFLFLASCSPSPTSNATEKVLPKGPIIKIVTDWTFLEGEGGMAHRAVRYIEIDGRFAIETMYGHGGSICIVPPR